MSGYSLKSICPVCDRPFNMHTLLQIDICYKISSIDANEKSIYYHENEGFHN